jgi:hypothetical protein
LRCCCRHASGATLQHLNFCIPAEQLDPIITLLSKHAQLLGPGPQEEQGATERLVQQLVALDVHDPDAERWVHQVADVTRGRLGRSLSMLPIQVAFFNFLD